MEEDKAGVHQTATLWEGLWNREILFICISYINSSWIHILEYYFFWRTKPVWQHYLSPTFFKGILLFQKADVWVEYYAPVWNSTTWYFFFSCKLDRLFLFLFSITTITNCTKDAILWSWSWPEIKLINRNVILCWAFIATVVSSILATEFADLACVRLRGQLLTIKLHWSVVYSGKYSLGPV